MRRKARHVAEDEGIDAGDSPPFEETGSLIQVEEEPSIPVGVGFDMHMEVESPARVEAVP
jgi:hypothetical protein